MFPRRTRRRHLQRSAAALLGCHGNLCCGGTERVETGVMRLVQGDDATGVWLVLVMVVVELEVVVVIV